VNTGLTGHRKPTLCHGGEVRGRAAGASSRHGGYNQSEGGSGQKQKVSREEGSKPGKPKKTIFD